MTPSINRHILDRNAILKQNDSLGISILTLYNIEILALILVILFLKRSKLMFYQVNVQYISSEKLGTFQNIKKNP